MRNSWRRRRARRLLNLTANGVYLVSISRAAIQPFARSARRAQLALFLAVAVAYVWPGPVQ